MICESCNKQRLKVSPFITSSNNTKNICAICALRKKNIQHGLPEGTPFDGSMAQKMYLDEIDFEKQ